jgi:hypothetical protein
MNEETTQKQVWQTPEVVDLDVDKTAGGTATGVEITPGAPHS